MRRARAAQCCGCYHSFENYTVSNYTMDDGLWFDDYWTTMDDHSFENYTVSNYTVDDGLWFDDSCSSTDAGATDTYNDTCAWYLDFYHAYWGCGYFDDADFTANDMVRFCARAPFVVLMQV